MLIPTESKTTLQPFAVSMAYAPFLLASDVCGAARPSLPSPLLPPPSPLLHLLSPALLSPSPAPRSPWRDDQSQNPDHQIKSARSNRTSAIKNIRKFEGP